MADFLKKCRCSETHPVGDTITFLYTVYTKLYIIQWLWTITYYYCPLQSRFAFHTIDEQTTAHNDWYYYHAVRMKFPIDISEYRWTCYVNYKLTRLWTSILSYELFHYLSYIELQLKLSDILTGAKTLFFYFSNHSRYITTDFNGSYSKIFSTIYIESPRP